MLKLRTHTSHLSDCVKTIAPIHSRMFSKKASWALKPEQISSSSPLGSGGRIASFILLTIYYVDVCCFSFVGNISADHTIKDRVVRALCM